MIESDISMPSTINDYNYLESSNVTSHYINVNKKKKIRIPMNSSSMSFHT